MTEKKRHRSEFDVIQNYLRFQSFIDDHASALKGTTDLNVTLKEPQYLRKEQNK